MPVMVATYLTITLHNKVHLGRYLYNGLNHKVRFCRGLAYSAE